MKDAFGGAFMIQIFLVFIIIYISFTALAINYAKAFKVKDRIIEYIEGTEGLFDIDNPSAKELDDMQHFIDMEIHGHMNYYANIPCGSTCSFDTQLPCDVYCQDGIQITKIGKGQNTEGSYYRVTTAFGWNIGFFNVINKLANRHDEEAPIGNWKISGETRLIVNEDQ